MFRKINPNRKLKLSRESVISKVKNEFNGNISEASRQLGIERRTLNNWLNNKISSVDKINRFVITYAQNNTAVHQGFFDSLRVYMHENIGTELICYKGFYDPKRDTEKLKPEDVWYDAKIHPYLMNTARHLNSNVQLYPAHTRPTAVHPLSGYETHTGDKSGIFPHPKLQFKTIATPGSKMPKILSTTGAITLPNYSVSKAGEKGSQHHIIGAVIVEIKDDKIFHLRQINADKEGNFYDYAGGRVKRYTPKGVYTKQHIASLFCGDTHMPFVNPMVMTSQATLIKKFKPKHIFLNDVTDFWRENHHERGNRFMKYAKNKNGQICVKEEVKEVARFIEELRDRSKAKIYIIRSNHDEALERWLNEANVDHLGQNAAYFHYLSYHKHESLQPVDNGYKWHNSLEFACNEFLGSKKDIQFLDMDESCIIAGIENGYHGHYGPNGSRGSVKGFSKIGVKTNTGHGHSPEILDGAYRAGINCYRLGYVRGPSSQLETDIITYLNGKRTLVNYINGEYCI